jgi:hypothetical protein
MTIAGDHVAAANRYRTIFWLALVLCLVHWTAPQPGSHNAAAEASERALSVATPRPGLRQKLARSPNFELRRPRIDRTSRAGNRHPTALSIQQATPSAASALASRRNVELVGLRPSFLRVYYSRAPPGRLA